jgi:hypothetical protein
MVGSQPRKLSHNSATRHPHGDSPQDRKGFSAAAGSDSSEPVGPRAEAWALIRLVPSSEIPDKLP